MSNSLPDDRAATADEDLSHRQIVTIIVGLMLAMFLAALDQTVVSTAIRTIADDLDGFSLQAWATTAFLITSTIATPLYGKLSDMYGRKPFFLFAISIFIAGSALCGLSRSMYELAAFRAVQGIGAGGLFALALAIVGDIVPPRQRARYQGYFLAVFATSSVLGPVLGGLLAGADSIAGVAGWRWIFYVNVPIGFVALIVINRVLHVQHRRTEHRVDWPGAVALIVGLVPLLTVAEQGRTWGWMSGRSLLCYVIGLVGVAAFIAAERAYGDDALLPLRLFRNRTFSVVSISSFVVGSGMFGALLMLPLYLQIVQGYSPTKAGLATIPLVVGIMLGSVIAGQVIARTGRYRAFPIIGTALMVLALGLFALVGADTPVWRLMLIMPIMGLGLGGTMQPITLAVQNAVSPREIGVATSSATFFRQMGGTLGAAGFLSVLFSGLPGKIGDALTAARQTPEFAAALQANPDQAAVLRNAAQGGGNLDDTSFISRLAPALAHPFKVGFSDSTSLVFLLAAVVMVIGLAVIFFLPELPLAERSGSQARADELASQAEALSPTTPAAVAVARPDAGDGRHEPSGDPQEVRVPADGTDGSARHATSGEDGLVRGRPAAG